MSVQVLGDIAHARAGDKGNTSILVVVPFDVADTQRIRATLDSGSISRHFGNHGIQRVVVKELSDLGAFLVVLDQQLAGGVTRSLRFDTHGKTLGAHLLDLPLA